MTLPPFAAMPGIGVDLCQVSRMEKSLQKPAFWERVFAPAERAWLDTLPETRRAQSAAANFAAKEALLKAVGTGLGGLAMNELAVLRAESGAPYMQLSGQAAVWAATNGIRIRVSLSHDGGMACAFVVLEQGKKSVSL